MVYNWQQMDETKFKLLMIAGLITFSIVCCSKENNNGNVMGNNSDGGSDGGQGSEADPTELGYTYVGITSDGGACYDLCQSLGYTGIPYYDDYTSKCYCK